METKVSGVNIYEGKIIKVDVVEAICTNGNKVKREIVYHNGGSAIALKNNEGNYYLVRQYRYGQKMELLEFPAGKLEVNENPLEAIKRECIEELGYSAKDIVPLGMLVPTGAYLSERIFMYHGIQDEYLGQNLDENEDITIEIYSIGQLVEMVKTNHIIDAKTVAMIFKIIINEL